MRENLVRIQVYLQDQTVQIIEEQPAYPVRFWQVYHDKKNTHWVTRAGATIMVPFNALKSFQLIRKLAIRRLELRNPIAEWNAVTEPQDRAPE